MVLFINDVMVTGLISKKSELEYFIIQSKTQNDRNGGLKKMQAHGTLAIFFI